MGWRLRALLVAAGVIALGVGAPAAAQTESPASVMELNRNGEWFKAASLAEALLAGDDHTEIQARCELIYHLAYARARLGEDAAARSSIRTFDQECRGIGADHWINREIGHLREELNETQAVNRSDGFWTAAHPSSLGLDATVVKEHGALCESTGADACLLVYRGRIVQEWYSPRYREPIYAMSTTKSITGLLVGMMMDEGAIRDLDQPVCTWIVEWCEGWRSEVTVGHLLSMTSGLPRMREGSVGYVSDKNAYVIGLEPTAKPGSRWAYSNEAVQLLSPVLDKAAGEPSQLYAERRLFQPLGMSRTRLHLDEKGHAWTYADMQTTPRDLARIGLLLLNEGVWGEERVLSKEWIERSTRPSQPYNRDYGLLWWLHDEPIGYAGHGYLDTSLHIFPDLQLIAVRMQARPSKNDAEGMYEAEALELFRRLVP